MSELDFDDFDMEPFGLEDLVGIIFKKGKSGGSSKKKKSGSSGSGDMPIWAIFLIIGVAAAIIIAIIICRRR